HLLRLRPGHDHVVEALQDEQGTIYAFGEVNGRARPVNVEPLRIRRNEAVRVARLEFVRVTRQCLHVADAVVARTGGEDVVERDRTQRRVPAGAAAPYGQPAPIDHPLLGQVAGGVDAVVDINNSPRAIEAAHVLAAIAGADDVVDVDHREAATGEDLSLERE